MKTQTKKQDLSDLKWLPYLLSAMGAIAFSQYFSLKTSNQYMLIFAILLFPLFRKRYSEYTGFGKTSCLCGAVFSLFTVGSALINNEAVMETFSKVETFPPLIAYFIMFFFFYEALCHILLKKAATAELISSSIRPTMKGKLLVFFGSMLIMLIMWLPFLLYLYPGVLTEDSEWQLLQATGKTELTNHHPVVHTMIIKLTFGLGQWLFNGDDTKAVLVYSITQQIFLAGCFAYLIETLYSFKVKKVFLIASLLFYCIPVYHGMYSVTMWKDIWFGGITAALIALILRLLSKSGKFRLSVIEAVLLFVLSVGMSLMRSNGIYAFMLLLLAGIIVFFKRNKATVVIMSAALITAFIIKGPVYTAMGVKPVDLIESLSIPVQQISAVASQPNNLTPEQTELLENVVDIDRIADTYEPVISDPIKSIIREKDNQDYIAEHKEDFLKLWISLGLSYPDIYLKAYVNQTCGYWYPDVQYWIATTNGLSSSIDIKNSPKTGALTGFMDNYCFSYIETPFFGLFSSIGLGVWVLIFMAGAAIKKHGAAAALIYIPVVGVWLTLLIATPVYSEFRYIYCLFTALPLFCAVPFININDALKAPVTTVKTVTLPEQND